jgi:hypothetical protein
MTPADRSLLAQHQQARQFNVSGAALLEEIYGHLSAVRSDLITDRIDAEHVATARSLTLIAWRAQRAITQDNINEAELDAMNALVSEAIGASA